MTFQHIEIRLHLSEKLQLILMRFLNTVHRVFSCMKVDGSLKILKRNLIELLENTHMLSMEVNYFNRDFWELYYKTLKKIFRGERNNNKM